MPYGDSFHNGTVSPHKDMIFDGYTGFAGILLIRRYVFAVVGVDAVEICIIDRRIATKHGVVANGDAVMAGNGRGTDANVVADGQHRIFAYNKLALPVATRRTVIGAIADYQIGTCLELPLERDINEGNAPREKAFPVGYAIHGQQQFGEYRMMIGGYIRFIEPPRFVDESEGVHGVCTG